jgi:acyl carrier protein
MSGKGDRREAGMEKRAVLKEVNRIFVDVLDDEAIVLGEETTADDIEEWDSLTHVRLIISIEKRFNIRFTSLEIQKFKNVGDICEAIAAKTE